MLIQFTVGNYRSFLTPKTLSLEATSINEFPENVFKAQKLKLLKSAVLYGANSSGKSNFLRAMGMMKDIISSSFEQSSASGIPFDPFTLKKGNSEKPSFFEVVFAINDIKYRYGFETNEKKIIEEWLYETVKRAEKPLFIRVEDGIQVFSRFKEAINLEEKTRDNTLFLTVIDQFNGTKAKKIIQWFHNFNILDGISHKNYRSVTYDMLENPKTRSLLTDFYRELDLGFEEIMLEKETFDPKKIASNMPEDLLKQIITDFNGKTIISLSTQHKMFDDGDNFIENMAGFDVRKQESSGTNKVIDLSGPIFDTLMEGGTIIIDELDAKLHPLLTIAIVKLFQNEKTNPKSAQLIFATHSTNVLKLGRLRRDQIYFSDKDEYGRSDLYSLVEYDMEGKKVRKDNSFEKDYIDGRYGAIPTIGSLNKLF